MPTKNYRFFFDKLKCQKHYNIISRFRYVMELLTSLTVRYPQRWVFGHIG